MSLIKYLQTATGKEGLWAIAKKSGLSVLLDGNWGESALWSASKNTRHVGTDALGNQYFEDLTRMYGRHRWVIYKDMSTYHGSQVTAEWHAWLHCISDDAPSEKPAARKFFEIDYVPNPTGTYQKYLPKGSWANPEERNWRKVQFWDPSK